MTTRRRRPARVGIVLHRSGEFDSRSQRLAASLAARGDTVTLYSFREPGLPETEERDGYRIVRVPGPLDDGAEASPGATDEERDASPTSRGLLGAPRQVLRSIGQRLRRRLRRWPPTRRFLFFPIRPVRWSRGLPDLVEPHDIWHGMWAGSLPALARLRARHGGRTVYDARDIYLRSRQFEHAPGWQRRLLSRLERHWAHAADAVVSVSPEYAAELRTELGLRDIAVVRNCPERWVPPEPRPDRIRALLSLPPSTRIVLYQGLLMSDRGIEQTMDAILEVPDAVLVLMGTGHPRRYHRAAARAPHAGRVHVIDPVPPRELLGWTASADVTVMAIQPTSLNHELTTPQKLWESMAAGVPVVASDLPGMAGIVRETGCGELCDPTSPSSIADAIRRVLDQPGGPRRMGDLGLAAAHDRYHWAAQLEVLDVVYARLLERHP
ncbi:MAG: glycosyltransferase [Chloroflexi bacterium]|nr:glycosyltransferase [Chloroflexota bacterium]